MDVSVAPTLVPFAVPFTVSTQMPPLIGAGLLQLKIFYNLVFQNCNLEKHEYYDMGSYGV